MKELSEAKHEGRVVYSESQCGFDGRLIQKNPEFAELLKKARFKNVRIAWDHSYDTHEDIGEQISLLEKAGYTKKNLYIFMIYNWDHDLEEIVASQEGTKSFWIGPSSAYHLQNPDPEVTREAVRECFYVIGKTGLIITPCPSLHSIMPWESGLAMIDEWKRLR